MQAQSYVTIERFAENAGNYQKVFSSRVLNFELFGPGKRDNEALKNGIHLGNILFSTSMSNVEKLPNLMIS